LAYSPVVNKNQNSLTTKTVGQIKTHDNENPENITIPLDTGKIRRRNLTKIRLSILIIKNH
ncbi:hypothetical protein S83_070083, partial [Arachis hypogaea]